MSTMIITIERSPRTLQLGDTVLQVEELSARLPFARKPADLRELGRGDQCKVYVTETKELTAAEFDAFARRLRVSRDWLRGKGGGTGDGFLCVEVPAPGRPYLYINPEGGDYARYVARLG
ncbi:hypothetical protein GHV10_18540 [Pseudomonas aeruginosa]|nr:hypothetical protein [Pseudomonas aeruginosa]